MKQLIVRNLDERLVQVLKLRAAAHGVSMEAEHRNILVQALLQPAKRSFAEVLARMPNVGAMGSRLGYCVIFRRQSSRNQ